MKPLLSLTEELECAGYGVKAEALAKAYDRFAEHGCREQFRAEVQAIRDCRIIDFIEHRGQHHG